MRRFAAATILVAPILLVAHAAASAAESTGDLWEVTSQMTMEGMPAGMGMPAQTRRVCAAHDWTKPPVADSDRNCQTSDFRSTPTKTTWKMSCQGMTGEGEITRTSPEAYTGWIKMAAPQGAMTLNLTGHRVGDCDAAEAKKDRDAAVAHAQAQIAAGQKTMDDAKRQACMTSVESLDLNTFNTQAALCDVATYKPIFCDKAKTDEGVKTLCKRDKSDPPNGLSAIAKFCDADADALRKTMCEKSKTAEDFPALGACCPEAARALAVEHCAGRTYTSLIGDKYQAFCAEYAKELLDAAPGQAPPESAGQKTKKSLKNLIPH